MDAQAIYYTLSTIAQTLAGALAILVAAVLFKLSSLSKERELAADILRNNGIDPDIYRCRTRVPSSSSEGLHQDAPRQVTIPPEIRAARDKVEQDRKRERDSQNSR